MEPNKNNIKLWVDALLSGNYEQTNERLTKIDEYGHETDCCLGVACKVAIENGVPLEIEIIEDYTLGTTVKYSGRVDWLPEPVQAWLGFDVGDPFLATDEVDSEWRRTATDLNDDARYSLSQIAEAIQKEYLE